MIETINNLEKTTEKFFTETMKTVSNTFTSMFIVIGDQLKLFKKMVKLGPVDSKSLSSQMEFEERYVREWLNACYSARILDYNSETGLYSLPDYAIPVLAQDNSPFSLNILFHQMFPTWFTIDKLMNAFRIGGGIPHNNYDERLFEGIARETDIMFESNLVNWIKLLPELDQKLMSGGDILDIGCGHGTALFVLAQAYPNAKLIGYDLHMPSIEIARNKAKELGLQSRVTFVHQDLQNEIEGTFDLVTAFDVIHDLGTPQIIFNNVSNVMKAGGTFLIKDFVTSDNVEENVGDISTILYGFSLAYCMTSSLSTGDSGLGTMGLTWNTINELSDNAGFSNIEVLVQEDEMNIIYHLTR